MNDYLAKPVKGKILEKMLVKWALEVKKPNRRPLSCKDSSGPPKIHGTATQGTAARNGLSHESSSVNSVADTPSPRQPRYTQPEHASTLATKLTHLDLVEKAAVQRSSETVEASTLRHLNNEEKAMMLRNDQLIASGDDPKTLSRGASEESMNSDVTVSSPSVQGGASHQLTRENMEKFEEKTGSGGVSIVDGMESVVHRDETSSMNVLPDESASVRGKDTRRSLLSGVKGWEGRPPTPGK